MPWKRKFIKLNTIFTKLGAAVSKITLVKKITISYVRFVGYSKDTRMFSHFIFRL